MLADHVYLIFQKFTFIEAAMPGKKKKQQNGQRKKPSVKQEVSAPAALPQPRLDPLAAEFCNIFDDLKNNNRPTDELLKRGDYHMSLKTEHGGSKVGYRKLDKAVSKEPTLASKKEFKDEDVSSHNPFKVKVTGAGHQGSMFVDISSNEDSEEEKIKESDGVKAEIYSTIKSGFVKVIEDADVKNYVTEVAEEDGQEVGEETEDVKVCVSEVVEKEDGYNKTGDMIEDVKDEICVSDDLQAAAEIKHITSDDGREANTEVPCYMMY